MEVEETCETRTSWYDAFYIDRYLFVLSGASHCMLVMSGARTNPNLWGNVLKYERVLLNIWHHNEKPLLSLLDTQKSTKIL